jgi:DNA-binding response OmpR family regulator
MSKGTILLLDPCDATRSMYGDYLRFHGYAVAEGADGAEGLRMAGELWPDVLVTELRLPFIDGIELIRSVRYREPVPFTGVIVCATVIDSVWPDAPADARPDTALAKPVAPRTLLLEVQRLVERRFATALSH